jgi:hypothetical protein
MALVEAKQASEREERKHCNDDRRKRRVATLIQSCWRRLLARKELQRLQKEAKTLSFIPVNDSRTNHIEKTGNDTIWVIKKQSDSNSNVNCTTIQFHNNSYNSQSDRWIGLKVYEESPNMFSYLGVNF